MGAMTQGRRVTQVLKVHGEVMALQYIHQKFTFFLKVLMLQLKIHLRVECTFDLRLMGQRGEMVEMVEEDKMEEAAAVEPRLHVKM